MGKRERLPHSNLIFLISDLSIVWQGLKKAINENKYPFSWISWLACDMDTLISFWYKPGKEKPYQLIPGIVDM